MACAPRKCFVYPTMDSDLILGGRGGGSQCAPPSVCNPDSTHYVQWLFSAYYDMHKHSGVLEKWVEHQSGE